MKDVRRPERLAKSNQQFT